MKALSMKRSLNFFRTRAVLLVLGTTTALTMQAAAAAEPQLKLSPAAALRAFEGPEDEVYTLGAGDEITVEAVGRPELSGKHVVGPDGRITLPLGGPVTLAGRTREQAGDAVAAALTPFYERVSVTVGVDKYASNRILVLGRVAKPGVLYFDRTPTLLDALAQSGGLAASASTASSGAAVSGASDTIPSRCAIYRGKDQVLWVNVRDMLEGGQLADLRLRRNDVIYVPAEQDAYVSVLGEVQHPGAFRLTPGLSVTELFAMAGGLNDNAAAKHIRLIRPDSGVSREVALDDLISPTKSVEFTLRKGDVIYVPPSGLSKVGYFLQKLSPATTLMMFSGLGR